MKRITLLAVLLPAALVLWGAAPGHSLTIAEILELCNAGYSTGDVLEFVETLGLDEPLDSDALIRLKEEGCGSDLAVELLRTYGAEEAAGEVIDEDYDADYSESSTRVYIQDGWGYPYYSYSDWWWSGWHSPWWGVGYSWYDPWYWDYRYWPGYYSPYYYNSYWGCNYNWGWSYSNYHHVTAHNKTDKTRGHRRYRTGSDRDRGDYRAATSRTLVEKSYRARDRYKVRTISYTGTDAPNRSKSEYRLKHERRGSTASSSERTIKKGSSTRTARTDRTDRIGKAKNKGASTSDRPRKIKRSSGSSKSSSGSYRSSGAGKSRGSSGIYKRGGSSSGSSGKSRGSSSGSTVKRGGGSSGSSSSGKGPTTSSSSSSGSSKSSSDSSSGSRTRRR